jgi:hypothetical protein
MTLHREHTQELFGRRPLYYTYYVRYLQTLASTEQHQNSITLTIKVLRLQGLLHDWEASSTRHNPP